MKSTSFPTGLWCRVAEARSRNTGVVIYDLTKGTRRRIEFAFPSRRGAPVSSTILRPTGVRDAQADGGAAEVRLPLQKGDLTVGL